MSLFRGEIGKTGTALTALVFVGSLIYQLAVFPFGPYIVFMVLVHVAVIVDCALRLMDRRAPLSELFARASRR